jgi:tRNA pseudouridine38-40 synthase
MKRMKAIFAYDGTRYCGFQIQINGITVQEQIEKALKKLHKGTPTPITASGRTDAGVHARGQVVHFDTPLAIPPERWTMALNRLLPSDITLVSIEEVDPNFHARYSVVGKEYRYELSLGAVSNPFTRNLACHVRTKLDLVAMRQGAQHLIGTHDFTSFCSAKTEKTNLVRTIDKIEILPSGDKWILRFVGNGFLYNMIRIIIGTLLEIGRGKLHPDEMINILEKKDRAAAGKTAPAHGLYLWEVFYNN